MQKTVTKVQNKMVELIGLIDCAKQMFALVSGGSSKRVLLYDVIPQSSADKPKAQVVRGTWLKLSYPKKIQTENSVPYTWYRAHIMQGDEIKLYWVRNKAEDGQNSFAKMQFWVTQTIGEDLGDVDEEEDDEDDEEDD
jgi:hypothetical protein